MVRDDEIIEMYWRRDERAIAESSEKYGTRCFAVADNLLKSREDSEECVNDTWLRSWNSIPPQRPLRLFAFFVKITRNLALDKWQYLRAAKRGGGEIPVSYDEMGEIAGDEYDPEDILETRNLGRDIDTFLRSIPKRDANIFIRRYFFIETVTEISSKYGIAPNNISVILSRTRKKLRAYLIEEGYNL